MMLDTRAGTRGAAGPAFRYAVQLFGTTPTTSRVSFFLLGVTATVMAVFVAVFGAHRIAGPLTEAKVFVDIGGEANLPTWWNASLLLLVAAAAAVAAVHSNRSVRKGWVVVALAGAYLSLDETAGLHERMARPILAAEIDTSTYPWLIMGGIVAAAGAAVLIAAGRRLPRDTARRLLLALGCYAVGALGVEAVNGFIGADGHGLLFSFGLILEEGLEMLACILAAAAIVDHLLTGGAPGTSGSPPVSSDA